MCAIGTPGGLMSGEQLIRYHTPSEGVVIHSSTDLKQRKISVHQSGTLSSNQLSVPEHVLIYSGEQAFLFKVLQQITQHCCHHPSEWCELSHIDMVTSAAPQHTPWTSILFRDVGYLLHVLFLVIHKHPLLVTNTQTKWYCRLAATYFAPFSQCNKKRQYGLNAQVSTSVQLQY